MTEKGEPADLPDLPPTEAMDVVELEPDAATPEPTDDPPADIDALFGDDRFREYEPGIVPPAADNPFAWRPEPVDPAAPRRRLFPARTGARAAAAPAPPKVPVVSGARPSHHLSHTQKILLGVLGVLLALLVIVALFFAGLRLSEALGPSPALATPSASPSATAAPRFVAGPVAPGHYAWSELLGGECLRSYKSPWDPTFTVVDCAKSHVAQLVYRGTFAGEKYPGADVLATAIVTACMAPGVVDLTAAAAITDAQVAGSYPVTAEEWASGQRTYSCFVSRSGGEPLTGSIAIPQTAAPVPFVVAPAATATPAP